MFDAQLQTLVTSLVVCGVREYWNGEGTRFLCFISPHINIKAGISYIFHPVGFFVRSNSFASIKSKT